MNEVSLKVTEVSPYFLNLSAEVEEYKKQLLGAAKCGLRNSLGIGDIFQCNFKAKGLQNLETVDLDLLLPLHRINSLSFLDIGICQSTKRSPELTVISKGPKTSINLSSTDKKWTLISELSLAMREAKPQLGKSKRGVHLWNPVLPLAGHSLTSSLTTILEMNSLDCLFLPMSGAHVGTKYAAFYYHNIEKPKTGHQLQCFANFYIPLGYLKSSISIRNFVCSSVDISPMDNPQCLQSDLFKRSCPPEGTTTDNTHVISVLAFTSKMPFLTEGSMLGRNLRFQCYASSHKSSHNLSTVCNLSKFSTILGVGLIGKLFDSVRLELNYCLPFYFGPKRNHKQGLQFSFGTEFL